MAANKWEPWLAKWSDELLQRIDATLADRFNAAGYPLGAGRREGAASGRDAGQWLGYPPATPDQLARLEARLGRDLPPSYRAFLQASNGFLQPGMLVWRLLPVDEVEWFRVRNAQTLEALKPVDGETAEILAGCLEISAREMAGTAVFLLNSRVVGADGEWEALHYAHWNPGIRRYASLWDLMQSEYRSSVLHNGRGEGRLRRGDDPATVLAKLPLLVQELERRAHCLARDPYVSGVAGSPRALDALQAATARVRTLVRERRPAEQVLQQLEGLRLEFLRAAAPGRPPGMTADQSAGGDLLAGRDGWLMAATAILWFLNAVERSSP